jgi:alkylhydroperoxidase family enzyme
MLVEELREHPRSQLEDVERSPGARRVVDCSGSIDRPLAGGTSASIPEIGMKLFGVVLPALLFFSMGLVASAEGDLVMRIRPLEMSEWSPEILKKLAGMARNSSTVVEGEDEAPGGNAKTALPSMLKTVAHHPDLMDPFLDFSAVIAQRGALSRRDSELLALRAAWNCQSEFEWGHHLEYALEAGFSREEIARIPVGPRAEGWSATERALLEAADELHASQRVSDEVWAKLAGEYSDKQLVEILFVVGQYTMLSMFVNSSGVELEPGYEPLPKLPSADRK